MEKQLNRKYSVIQFVYYALFSIIFSFASVYLLGLGFNNTQIGLILSIVSISSIVIQLIVANIVDKYEKVKIRDVLSLVALIIMVGSILLIIFPVDFVIVPLVILIYSLMQSSTPLLNSLAYRYEALGVKINYGFARGMGSLAFALATVIMGYLIDFTSSDILPIFYAIFALLVLWRLRNYSLPAIQEQTFIESNQGANPGKQNSKQNIYGFIKKYRQLTLVMIGVFFLFLGHLFINNFFIQVLTPIGGHSGTLGVAIFIATVLEIPVMMNYNTIASKIPVDRLLKISAFFFLLKHTLTFLAPNIAIVYLAQILQIGAFSLAYPALVDYTSKIVATEDLVKGQALLATATATSSVLANLAGGFLIDQLGVSTTLLITVIASVIGLAIVFYAVEDLTKSYSSKSEKLSTI